jgi:hypothetical protein
MSAAATAAGYLYASGRLRGRAAREQEEHHPQQAERKPARKEIRVAVMPAREALRPARETLASAPEETRPAEAPRRMPKIEYRVRRRWSAE